ncbi:hypothetical protein SAMN05216416_0034 [Streptococcus equinus]|nr:hypothetical protein SAMN05216416_0034 [Streptococcus equinus]
MINLIMWLLALWTLLVGVVVGIGIAELKHKGERR